jgi:sugar phosphate isomerase/epimerase
MTILTRRNFLQQASHIAAAPIALRSFTGASTLFEQSGPSVHFSSQPRDRVSISSYPFREYITGLHDEKSASSSKMPIKDFAAHIATKFNVHKVEPWSEHFLSTEPGYLDQIRDAATKANVTFANIAADGENSLYSPDASQRDRAIQFGKQWIDVAAHLGSPSVRLNLASLKNIQPDLNLVVAGLRTIAEHAASKNVVVHLENDNPISENPFFLVKVLDQLKNPWVHALPDFGNSLAALPPDEAYRGVEQLFARAYAISHVKDTTTTPAKKVVEVDMEKIFEIAKKSNYQGNFSMEWETAGDVYAGTAKLIEITLKNLS